MEEHANEIVEHATKEKRGPRCSRGIKFED